MSELHIRRAEQKLRALADAFDRPSRVAEQFQREGFRPELWDLLDRIDRKKHELARQARSLVSVGATSEDVNAVFAEAERYEREEVKLFVRAFWDDVGSAE